MKNSELQTLLNRFSPDAEITAELNIEKSNSRCEIHLQIEELGQRFSLAKSDTGRSLKPSEAGN